jgi:TctA family transporter
MSLKEQIKLQAIASALLILIMALLILPALERDAPEYYITILVIAMALAFILYLTVKDFLKVNKTIK